VTGQAAVSNPLPYIAPFSEIGRAGPGTKEDRQAETSSATVYARRSLVVRNKIGDITRNRPEVEGAESGPQRTCLRSGMGRMAPPTS
jgi:hypothetical protein